MTARPSGRLSMGSRSSCTRRPCRLSPGRSLDPRRSNDVNVNGTVELVLAAAAAGVRRVVLAGSSSVYGSSGVLPRREDQPTDPRSPYAASKLAAEHYVHTIGAACGVESVVLRYFNVFGPGQDPAVRVRRGRSPVRHGGARAAAASRVRRWDAVHVTSRSSTTSWPRIWRQPSGRASPEGPSTSDAVAGSRSASCSARSRPRRGGSSSTRSSARAGRATSRTRRPISPRRASILATNPSSGSPKGSVARSPGTPSRRLMSTRPRDERGPARPR